MALVMCGFHAVSRVCQLQFIVCCQGFCLQNLLHSKLWNSSNNNRNKMENKFSKDKNVLSEDDSEEDPDYDPNKPDPEESCDDNDDISSGNDSIGSEYEEDDDDVTESSVRYEIEDPIKTEDKEDSNNDIKSNDKSNIIKNQLKSIIKTEVLDKQIKMENESNENSTSSIKIEDIKSEKNDSDLSEENSSFGVISNVVNGLISGKVPNEGKEKIKDEELEEEFDEPLINDLDIERHRIWKKNCVFLYETLITSGTKWPSLTVQWCPLSKQNKVVMNSGFREYTTEKLLLGTHSNCTESYVYVATQYIPIIDRSHIASYENGTNNPFANAKTEFYVKILHDGDVNRARYNPQNTFIIATSSSNNKNYIFDYSKHPSEPTSDESKPELILDYHQQEGYGLCWNNRKSNILATSAQDSNICIWDINGQTKSKTLSPTNSVIGHDGWVNDVKWHYCHDSYLGSVGQDKNLKFWDLRMNLSDGHRFSVRAHDDNVNTLSFNPFSEYIILTASDDCTIGLFDLRNLKHRLHSFIGHDDHVLDVNWSPFNETVFASSSKDKRLIIWDMTKISCEQSLQESKEGPPEMIFIHGGHMTAINDFSWHPDNQFIASVSAENVLHVFKPNFDLK